MNELPFYPLAPYGEPMYCSCDHGRSSENWCAKCPKRPEHAEAAGAEPRERYAKHEAEGSLP